MLNLPKHPTENSIRSCLLPLSESQVNPDAGTQSLLMAPVDLTSAFVR